jgi:transcription elongation GreA/GreB family factor
VVHPASQDSTVAKLALVQQLVELLRAERDKADRLARETADAANHPEARPENDKDTRKLELSYLAHGQAARAAELDATIADLVARPPRSFGPNDAIALGALVELESPEKVERVLLCSGGGGMSVGDDHGPVRIVTPEAPLGRALLGKTAGDEIELVIGGRKREMVIVSVG